MRATPHPALSDGTFAYFDAEDWSALGASTHPDFVYRDHRNGMHTEFDTQQWIESMQLMAASNARPERRQLSVLGDGAMLEWVRWTGMSEDAAAAGARFEVELLRVVTVDDAGLLTSVSTYDVQDRRAANDELWRLYEQADEGQRISALIYENRRAFDHFDLRAMRATLRDDFVLDDHRLTGSGVLGADAYVESVAALHAETEDMVSETLYVAAASEWGTLSVARLVGRVKGGGDFETEILRLFMTDGHLLTRVEIFELGDLDLAQARFEALVSEAEPRDVVTDVPGNAATTAMDRALSLIDADDGSSLDALVGSDFVFRDHRSAIKSEFDSRQWLETMQLVVASSARHERRRLSVLGDRVTLEWMGWAGTFTDAASDAVHFEVQHLAVVGVDDQGLLTSIDSYDVDDRSAANDELWRLYGQSPEGKQIPDVLYRNRIAFNRQDIDGVRATFRDDGVFDDHRRTGLGLLAVEPYLESAAALFDETGDFISETVYRVAASRWGSLSVGRTVGTAKDGGPFENLFLRLFMTDGDLITHVEIFELDQLDEAIARFAELSAEGELVGPRNVVRAGPSAVGRGLRRGRLRGVRVASAPVDGVRRPAGADCPGE